MAHEKARGKVWINPDCFLPAQSTGDFKGHESTLDSLDVRPPSLFAGSDTGLICETWGLEAAVIPAKAGIHSASLQKCAVYELDLRFRGNDRRFERDPTASDTAAQALALCAGRGFRDRLRVFRRTSGSLVLAREISEEENV